MKLKQVQKAESELLLATYDRYPVLVKRGRGVYLYDAQGKKYLDFLSGIGVNVLGYSHPAITKAIIRQAKEIVHTSNLFYHPYQAELAGRLTKISGMDRVFFSNSGTEAWEGALKIARAWAKHKCKPGAEPAWRVLAMENAFHGRTFGAVSTTATAKYREPFAPLLPGVEFVRFNDVADLKNKFDSTVCAIGMEPVQGEGGIVPVSREFFAAARELATKHGALLIADEIQSGLGRTGKYFAYQHYGVRPDVVTVAKPLAGGLPLGAILATEEVGSCLHPGMHGTTFGGGPLACAVAIEFLKTLEREKLLKHVQKTGAYFSKQLEELKKKHSSIREVRGMGLMLGLEMDSTELAKSVARELLEKRIVINRTHETVLRFLPPFIVENKHVDQVVNELDEALKSKAVASAAGSNRRAN